MNPTSFEHIVRIQFNALMMTVIKCTVKNRNRQFARRSKREVLFCELSDTKNVECVTKDNYSCDYIVSAKYSCGFSIFLVSSIIVDERYLDYFTTITEDRL